MPGILPTSFQIFKANHPTVAKLLFRQPFPASRAREELRGFLERTPASFDETVNMQRTLAVKLLDRLPDTGSADLLLRIAGEGARTASTEDRTWILDRNTIDAALELLGKMSCLEAIPLLKDLLAGEHGCERAAYSTLAAAAESLRLIERPAKGSTADQELLAYSAVYNYADLFIAGLKTSYYVDRPMPETACEKEARAVRRFGTHALPALTRNFRINHEPFLLRNLLALTLFCDPAKGIPFVEGVRNELKDIHRGPGLTWESVNYLLNAFQFGTLKLVN